jgi:hypothetical protein
VPPKFQELSKTTSFGNKFWQQDQRTTLEISSDACAHVQRGRGLSWAWQPLANSLRQDVQLKTTGFCWANKPLLTNLMERTNVRMYFYIRDPLRIEIGHIQFLGTVLLNFWSPKQPQKMVNLWNYEGHFHIRKPNP